MTIWKLKFKNSLQDFIFSQSLLDVTSVVSVFSFFVPVRMWLLNFSLGCSISLLVAIHFVVVCSVVSLATIAFMLFLVSLVDAWCPTQLGQWHCWLYSWSKSARTTWRTLWWKWRWRNWIGEFISHVVVWIFEIIFLHVQLRRKPIPWWVIHYWWLKCDFSIIYVTRLTANVHTRTRHAWITSISHCITRNWLFPCISGLTSVW